MFALIIQSNSTTIQTNVQNDTKSTAATEAIRSASKESIGLNPFLIFGVCLLAVIMITTIVAVLVVRRYRAKSEDNWCNAVTSPRIKSKVVESSSPKESSDPQIQAPQNSVHKQSTSDPMPPDIASALSDGKTEEASKEEEPEIEKRRRITMYQKMTHALYSKGDLDKEDLDKMLEEVMEEDRGADDTRLE